ncbi:response regulator transcription factor [Methyloglobulus sp.]|uniref:response regulator transcription factor n=1 Tax=Methyloglobulus sp. TaxID=2518622 RepID=UPI00398944AF
MSQQNNPPPESKDKTDLLPKPNSVLSSGIGALNLHQVMEATSASPPLNKALYSALIVDDNASFQKLLALSLSMHPQIGVIDFADNGENAIKKANAQQYDLIFIDAMMPGIDGYETCARLREMPEYKATPIIMVTGLDSHSDEVKGIIAGTTNYVTKPVQQAPFKELLARVLTLLEYKKD